MGQVITLMPLLNQTLIVENGEFNNMTTMANTITKKPTPSMPTPTPAPPVQPKPLPIRNSGSGLGTPINIGGAIGNVGITPPSSNNTQPDQMPVTPNYGLVPEGTGMGGYGSGGFASGGFGGGDYEEPQINSQQSQILGYDETTKCPIYGYDENGKALYGVDLNGNIIYDPSQLPCALKSMPESEQSPISQIINDKTLRTSLIVLGGLALFTIIMKKNG